MDCNRPLSAAPSIRGYPLQRVEFDSAGRRIVMWGLKDAADLLDEPGFAKAFVEEDRPPYWAQLWPASYMLCEHLLSGPGGGGRWAIELGCGLGLGSIAAALQGYAVTATDYDPHALKLTGLNAQANGVTLAGMALLDWSACPDDRRYDVVLAADVLYERRLQPLVLGAVGRLLAPAGEALITDPNRRIARGFADEARAAGFAVETSTLAVTGLVTPPIAGTLYKLSRRADT